MTRDVGSTRRRFLRGGALVGGALLAGCTGGDSEGSGGDGTETTTASETTGGTNATETSGSDETTAGTDDGSGDESYSATMAPVGEVTFDTVPERWAVYEAGYADVGVALGVGGGLNAVGEPDRYHTDYYDELDGASIETGSLTPLYTDGIDKEVFYELNSDVHVIDPQWLLNNSAFGLERADIEEMRRQVAPFIGNTIFRRTDEWHTYRYYTMYEAFEKVAQVFQREERYRALESFHDEFVPSVTDRLPPEGERPNGLLVYPADEGPETFYPYQLSDRGTNKKQFRDLGITDALAGTGVEGLSTTDRGTIDYETILEVDPDSLLVRGYEDLSDEAFRNQVVSFMEDHPVASQLSAVRNELVFRGGPIYEGPIQNLFLTERFAKAYFPDTFTEDQLFDRGRVASIVTGN